MKSTPAFRWKATLASTMSASSRARSVSTSFIGSARLSAAQRGAEPPARARQSRRPAGSRGSSERPTGLEALRVSGHGGEDDAVSAVALGDRDELRQSGFRAIPVDDQRGAIELEHAASPAVRARDRPVDEVEARLHVEAARAMLDHVRRDLTLHEEYVR